MNPVNVAEVFAFVELVVTVGVGLNVIVVGPIAIADASKCNCDGYECNCTGGWFNCGFGASIIYSIPSIAFYILLSSCSSTSIAWFPL